MSALTISILIIGIILMIIGIIGLINPILPGLPVMFIASWVIAYAHDYQYISYKYLIIILIITIIGFAIDYFSSVVGAKISGANKKALLFTFLGGILGMFFMPIGIILGPIIGAIVGEFIEHKNLLKSGKVGLFTFIGLITGTIAKIVCAIMIVLILIFGYFVNR